MSQLGPYDLVTQIGDVVPIPSHVPFHCILGQTVPFYMSVYQLGVLTTPTAVTFSITDQLGNEIVGTVMANDVGDFEADMFIPQTANSGVWRARWETSGGPYEYAESVVDFYVDAPVALPLPSGACPAPTPTPPPTPPMPTNYILIDRSTTVLGVPNTVYVCDVTAGNIGINVPALAIGQTVTVIAVGGDYGAHSITVTSTGSQVFAQPAPNNLIAPASTYVIGGPSASSGMGLLDKGQSLTWVFGGVSNVLSISA